MTLKEQKCHRHIDFGRTQKCYNNIYMLSKRFSHNIKALYTLFIKHQYEFEKNYFRQCHNDFGMTQKCHRQFFLSEGDKNSMTSE